MRGWQGRIEVDWAGPHDPPPCLQASPCVSLTLLWWSDGSGTSLLCRLEGTRALCMEGLTVLACAALKAMARTQIAGALSRTKKVREHLMFTLGYFGRTVEALVADTIV